MRTHALIAAIFTAAGAVVAQQPLPRSNETIDVSIVNVDVVVTDRAGHHIPHLTAADFEIRVDGKLQPITNFSEYAEEISVAPAIPPASTAEIGGATPAPSEVIAPIDRRTVVVFIERSEMNESQASRFLGEIKRLLHETVRPGDAAAVVTWNYVMKVRQDFTSDLAALDRGVDSVATDLGHRGTDAATEMLRNAFAQELLDEAAIVQQREPVASSLLDGRERARHALIDIRRKAAAINTLIDTIGSVPGKRFIVMATHRFSQYAGAEYFNGEMPPTLRDEFDTATIRRELASNANAAGVILYAIYPENPEPTAFASVEEPPRRDAIMVAGRGLVRLDNDRWMKDAQKLARSGLLQLNETAAIDDLARRTGGVAAWGRSDIVKLVDTIRSDVSSYYSLAIRTPAAAAGRPRRISVSARNSAYAVRARHDLVPRSDERLMRSRVRAALYTRSDRSSLPFQVKLGNTTRTGSRFRIPVQIIVPVSALMTASNGTDDTGTFSIFAVAGGMLGVMSDVVQKTQSFSVRTVDRQAAVPAMIRYDFEIVSDGQADRIGVGVLDETSKQWGAVAVRIPKAAPRS